MTAHIDSADPAVHPSWGRTLPGVEGLRALAACSVILWHTYAVLGTGSLVLGQPFPTLLDAASQGVTIFFVISGFLLYRPFVLATLRRSAQPSTKNFLLNRFLRIYPAYAAILVITCVVLPGAILSYPTFDQHSVIVGRLAPGDFVANAFLVQGYHPSGVLTGLGVSWSLLPEVAFYLVLPLLGALAAYAARKTNATLATIAPAVAMLAIGVGGRLFAATINSNPASPETWHDVVICSLLGTANLFAMGMLAAVAYAKFSLSSERSMSYAGWLLVFVGAACMVGLPRQKDIGASIVATGLILVVMSPGAGSVNSGLVRALESRVPTFLGKISYSLYLWHLPLLLIAWRHGWFVSTTPFALVINLAGTAVVVVLLSAVSYRFIEAPAMSFKRPMFPNTARPQHRRAGADNSDRSAQPQD